MGGGGGGGGKQRRLGALGVGGGVKQNEDKATYIELKGWRKRYTRKRTSESEK